MEALNRSSAPIMVNKSYPIAMKDDLVKQIPSLESKYKKFDDYKDADH